MIAGGVSILLADTVGGESRPGAAIPFDAVVEVFDGDSTSLIPNEAEMERKEERR